MKLTGYRYLIIVIMALLSSMNQIHAVEAPLPMPMKAGKNLFVSDAADYMSLDAVDRVNKEIAELRKETSVEMAVAIVPTTGDESIEQFAYSLFEGWGLGKSDKSNGVLLLLAIQDRRVYIQTGYGVEGVLTDAVCSQIITRYVVPAMKENNVNKAVEDAVRAMCSILLNPDFRKELMSDEGERDGSPKAIDGSVFETFIIFIGIGAFLLTLVLFGGDISKTRKGQDNYDKSMVWRKARLKYAGLTVLSLGSGLIFLLIDLFLMQYYRNKRIKCDICGSKMRKLGEKEDNQYLDFGQDLEERIGSVDYDVWVCPDCGAVQRYAYRQNQSQYRECPNCHVVAMKEKSRKTLIPATVHQTGVGEITDECLACHHQEKKNYVIPKKPDPAVLAAAAIAAGASSRGNGGNSGGGGFTGFGGGHTGGGGAGGRW